MMMKLMPKFFYSNLKIPAIDVTKYLTQSTGWENDCKSVAETLRTYGLLIINDPRVNQQQNDNFLNLMERYFLKRSQQFRQGNKTIDFSP